MNGRALHVGEKALGKEHSHKLEICTSVCGRWGSLKSAPELDEKVLEAKPEDAGRRNTPTPLQR
jgi:hypothetical protein